MRRRVYHSEVAFVLRAILGDGPAEALLRLYAGRRLYVPHDPARSRLRHLVGTEGVVALREAFGAGCYVVVPRGVEVVDPREVVALRRRGLSNAEIARMAGCSVRTVQRAMRQAPT